MQVTLYHNPACGTSRTVLGIIRDAGIEPEIILYLKTPPSRETLQQLAQQSGQPVRTLLRQKGELYEKLGLADETVSDAAILDAIATHPELLNRPVVVSPLGTRVCRPKELVLDILPKP
ncbi:arsenate reductase (glutaredoxin) [Acetobacter orientalis]|uniref:Arsenate reductase n=1 Tax=Acetobacter orientalis TaxID=146474 RepID=A0A2Z5ZKJ7_9PROT|nr:arsenate reductase (glutaredoxin) [Acetobacter orientalis]BBC80557.1 arsenate reductase [Acetobacter orientalis]GAN64864.1 arsenate reductase [Acetobacter orientalis]GBR12467.1 arsenate reductase [Acetobacter orientalis NRIC 0481]GEL61408.1 arsenate reductase [Acetobacter orientalis]